MFLFLIFNNLLIFWMLVFIMGQKKAKPDPETASLALLARRCGPRTCTGYKATFSRWAASPDGLVGSGK